MDATADLQALFGRSRPEGGAWLEPRWWTSRAPRPAHRLSDVARAMRVEWYRDLRRYAGDERLPSDLRVQLREVAQRSLAASSKPDERTRFPRRWLRDRVKPNMPGAAHPAGIVPRVAAIGVRRRPDTCADAVAWLIGEGYSVVQLGGVADSGLAGVIDLQASAEMPLPQAAYELSRASFVVCDTLDLQHAATLTATPSLLLNARDPFSGYPVRDDSLFTLATPVDLDTGETILPAAMIDEAFVRRVRNCAFRDTAPHDVLAAVREMHEGITTGWRERASQSRFRARVLAAGEELATHVPAVAEWAPDEGFIGDGRLAAWQADIVESGPSR